MLLLFGDQAEMFMEFQKRLILEGRNKLEIGTLGLR